jgi:hypothetical protein
LIRLHYAFADLAKVDGLEVEDGSDATCVEEVLSDAEVASTTALLAREMCEAVLDADAFA